jgi:hypothetical protein
VEQGQTWGEGGMLGALTRHLEAAGQADWLLHFARTILDRLLRR